MDSNEINERFGFHKATIEGPEATRPKHTELRQRMSQFADWLNEKLPDGRYKSLAFTSLEEASMWAHKSIASTAPLEKLDYTELTFGKIVDVLTDLGMGSLEANKAIEKMQGAGVLFFDSTN